MPTDLQTLPEIGKSFRLTRSLRHMPVLFWVAVASGFVHAVVLSVCLFLPPREMPVLQISPRIANSHSGAKPSPLGSPRRAHSRLASYERPAGR